MKKNKKYEIQKRLLIKVSKLPDKIDHSTYCLRFYLIIYFCNKLNNIQLIIIFILFLNFDLNKN